MTEAASILKFYESEFGPCPYPSLNLALVESTMPGGHSPPGMIVISVRPALLRGALRDDPGQLPGRAGVLHRPRARASVVGPRRGRTELSRALDLGGLRAVCGGLVGPPQPRRGRVPQHARPHGPLGASLRGQGPHLPRRPARPHRGRSPGPARGGLRQGRVRPSHAPPDRRRGGVRPRGRGPADREPLLQDRYGRGPGGPGDGLRPRPAALFRGVGVRHEPARAAPGHALEAPGARDIAPRSPSTDATCPGRCRWRSRSRIRRGRRSGR